MESAEDKRPVPCVRDKVLQQGWLSMVGSAMQLAAWKDIAPSFYPISRVPSQPGGWSQGQQGFELPGGNISLIKVCGTPCHRTL